MSELKDWVGIIGTLLGALAGGGIALLVSNRQYKYERAMEREKRDLSNFESIHKLLTTTAHQAGILSTQIIGQIGYGAAFKADSLGGKVPTEELRMLVEFYAPSLKPEVDQIAERWLVLGRTIAEAIMTKERTEDWKTKTVLAATLSSAEILKLSDVAKKKLNDLVARYMLAG
ncbi:MAG: hypothetical protein AABM33_08000 [Pseudomonadota bacterium]